MKEKNSLFIKDALNFRVMVSPLIVKGVYILGLIAVTFVGLNQLFDEKILIGLAMIIVGNVVWRVMCEFWVLFFSIHGTLNSIEKHLKK